MFVHIILRGLNIERVFVRGLDEEDGMDGLDLFTESQYAVMRMVTQHTTAASLYYYHSNTYQNNPDTVLRMFLAWLRFVANCQILFTGGGNYKTSQVALYNTQHALISARHGPL